MENALAGLDPALLADDEFARDLYAALCNVDWREFTTGRYWSGSWRSGATLVARLRGRGEGFMDFYCVGGEGRVTPRVRDALLALGWEPVAEHGGGRRYLGGAGSG